MVCVTTMYQPYQMNCYKYEYTVVCRCVWMEEFKYYYRREVNVLYRGGGELHTRTRICVVVVVAFYFYMLAICDKEREERYHCDRSTRRASQDTREYRSIGILPCLTRSLCTCS